LLCVPPQLNLPQNQSASKKIIDTRVREKPGEHYPTRCFKKRLFSFVFKSPLNYTALQAVCPLKACLCNAAYISDGAHARLVESLQVGSEAAAYQQRHKCSVERCGGSF
jgi:hypothetical protein